MTFPSSCSGCQNYSQNPFLKCAVHPKGPVDVNCRDFEARATTPLDRGEVLRASAMAIAAFGNQVRTGINELNLLLTIQTREQHCRMVGCTEDQLRIHQEVVSAIAVAQWFTSNNSIVLAGLELLYRNLAAGKGPFPTTMPESINTWTMDLLSIAAGEDTVPLEQRILTATTFGGLLPIAQAAWGQAIATQQP